MMTPTTQSSLEQFDQHQLQPMLKEVQSRLGTRAEGPEDIDFAQALAHQLTKALTAFHL
jgi:hypothetical protein